MLFKIDAKNNDYTKVNRVFLSSFGWKEKNLQEMLSNQKI